MLELRERRSEASTNESDIVEVDLESVEMRSREGSEHEKDGFCTSNEDRFRLVERAFDEIGAGKFHVMLFLTASLGFFVESAEMSMLSLLLPEFKKEWGADEESMSVISSFTGLGMVLGTTIFGRLSDVIGRKPVYQISLAITVTVGFLCSFATTVWSFAFMRLFLGLGYGGNVVSSATLLLESVPTAWRGFFSAMTSFSFTFGQLWVVLLSWMFMDSWGWPWVVRLVSVVGLPACVLLFRIPGSCRFAIMKGDYHRAVFIVEYIAKQNGVPCPPYFSVENLIGDGETGNQIVHKPLIPNFVGLVRGPHGSTLLPLATLWFLNSFAFGIIQFLPLEVSNRYSSLEDAEYKTAFAMSLGGLLGSFTVTFMASRVNRKTEIRTGLLLLGGAIMFVSQFTGPFPILFAVLAFNHVGMSIVFHGLYTYTPEVFPTSIRVTCFSICQLANRIAPIVSPYLLSHLIEEISFQVAGGVYSMLFFLACSLTIFLKRETFGQAMVEETNDMDDSSSFEPKKMPNSSTPPSEGYSAVSSSSPTTNLTTNTNETMSLKSHPRNPRSYSKD